MSQKKSQAKIALKGMNKKQFESWKSRSQANFAAEVVKSQGVTKEKAKHIAEESFRRHLPEGFETEGQYIYHIVCQKEQKPIGYAWLGNKADLAFDHAYLYDLLLFPEFRGKGYGTAAMKVIEQEALRLGYAYLQLHAFGHNDPAIQLYLKSGFHITNVFMSKHLGSDQPK